MNTKAILLASAVAVGSTYIFGNRKYRNYSEVLEKIEYNMKGVKNIKIIGSTIGFDVDIELVNPTNIAVDVPGNRLTVKTLHFFTPSGKKIAEAHPNVSEISMPANGSRIITNIPTVVDLVAISGSFAETLSVVLDTDKLVTAADLVLFGKSFTVTS